MTDDGIPDGWIAKEAEALRFGVWRFYRIIDPEGESSVQEDNWVTRDSVAMPGEDGLRRYLDDVRGLDDPGRVPPLQLAAHVGHFLIRGSSRESCQVRVVDDDQLGAAPPWSGLVDDRFVVRVWFQRDGYRQPVEVEQDGAGEVVVRWGETVTGRL